MSPQTGLILAQKRLGHNLPAVMQDSRVKSATLQWAGEIQARRSLKNSGISKVFFFFSATGWLSSGMNQQMNK